MKIFEKCLKCGHNHLREFIFNVKLEEPVIAMSLLMRYLSLDTDTFTGKVVAALRNEFDGHASKKAIRLRWYGIQ